MTGGGAPVLLFPSSSSADARPPLSLLSCDRDGYTIGGRVVRPLLCPLCGAPMQGPDGMRQEAAD